MRDPPPRSQHPAGRKIYFDPLFSENASKITAIFFKWVLHVNGTPTRKDDVRRYILRPPHGITSAAEIANKI